MAIVMSGLVLSIAAINENKVSSLERKSLLKVKKARNSWDESKNIHFKEGKKDLIHRLSSIRNDCSYRKVC